MLHKVPGVLPGTRGATQGTRDTTQGTQADGHKVQGWGYAANLGASDRGAGVQLPLVLGVDAGHAERRGQAVCAGVVGHVVLVAQGLAGHVDAGGGGVAVQVEHQVGGVGVPVVDLGLVEGTQPGAAAAGGKAGAEGGIEEAGGPAVGGWEAWRLSGVLHGVVGVPHRVVGVLHRVLELLHRVLGY